MKAHVRCRFSYPAQESKVENTNLMGRKRKTHFFHGHVAFFHLKFLHVIVFESVLRC